MAARSCSTSTTGPNLWGLAGHGAGEERYVQVRARSRAASAAPSCPIATSIVGTEEEIHIAGGARRHARGASKAIRALHAGDDRAEARRRWAASSFPAPSRRRSRTASSAQGFPVEVFNVLGAGDAFMSGFLRGWLSGEPLETCCAWANACGAFAVSRLLCSPEYPDLGGAAALPRARQPAPGAAQGRGAQPYPLGDDAPARSPAR